MATLGRRELVSSISLPVNSKDHRFLNLISTALACTSPPTTAWQSCFETMLILTVDLKSTSSSSLVADEPSQRRDATRRTKKSRSQLVGFVRISRDEADSHMVNEEDSSQQMIRNLGEEEVVFDRVSGNLSKVPVLLSLDDVLLDELQERRREKTTHYLSIVIYQEGNMWTYLDGRVVS